MEESGWKIPEKAKKPTSANEPSLKEPELSPLAKKLIAKKNHYHCLYDYVQIYRTYCFRWMASSRLTQKQAKQISQRGTVDERKERVLPGEYPIAQSKRKETFMASADLIATEVKDPLDGHERNITQTLEDVLDFHVCFETVLPFEDGNGRFGRSLMFKDCLRHGVTPFILDDKRQSRCLEGICQWPENRTCLLEVGRGAQERFAAEEALRSLLTMEDKFLPVRLRQADSNC